MYSGKPILLRAGCISHSDCTKKYRLLQHCVAISGLTTTNSRISRIRANPLGLSGNCGAGADIGMGAARAAVAATDLAMTVIEVDARDIAIGIQRAGADGPNSVHVQVDSGH